MRDFFEKCLVFGGIGLAFWLLTFDRRSPKQKRRDDARQSAWEDERRRNDAAADGSPSAESAQSSSIGKSWPAPADRKTGQAMQPRTLDLYRVHAT